MSTPSMPETPKGFVSKVLELDTDTKNGLMNGIQYIVCAIIPVAIVDMIIKNIFSMKDPSTRGSVELLAEVLGEAVITLVLLFIVHKIIIAIPTYTGTPMNLINYSTLSLVFLISTFALNHGMKDKMTTIFNRLKASWDGKSEDTNENKNKSNVSVSQPISGSVPTHQVSRADYINNHNLMAPPTQPPVVPSKPQEMPLQQQPQQEPTSGQQMYGGPANTLIDTDYNPAQQEPMAANSTSSAWSAW